MTKRLHPALLVVLVAACGDNLSPDPSPADDVDGGMQPEPEPEPDAPQPLVGPVGITFFDFSLAIDITPDGRYAAFEDISGPDATVHVHDTFTGVTTLKTAVGNPARDVATGISATGRISALYDEPVQAALWDETGGWTMLGSPHTSGCGTEEISGAFDVSADGHTTVGLAWNGCSPTAFRWSDAGGTGAFVPLQVLGSASQHGSPTPANRASVISDDGRIAAGFAQNGPIDRSPAVWNADGSGFLLDPTNMDVAGEVMSINADGSVVAGQMWVDGFVWTQASGMTFMTRLPDALPSEPIFPLAMSSDGAFVFGGLGSSFFSIPTAFVWSADRGMRSIAAIAVANGIALPEGLTLNSIVSASADGTVLIGTAMDAELNLKTFALRLPPTALVAP
jgi:hypothetical protein